MDFVKKTDPRAFVTVVSINEVNYQPKTQTPGARKEGAKK